MAKGMSEKEQIEREFGVLWSGGESVTIGDRIYTAVEMKKALDLWGADVVTIDLQPLPDDLFAFRFYDGDDRCIVVFVLDTELNIVRELRAHIAEWLQGEKYKNGDEGVFGRPGGGSASPEGEGGGGLTDLASPPVLRLPEGVASASPGPCT